MSSPAPGRVRAIAALHMLCGCSLLAARTGRPPWHLGGARSERAFATVLGARHLAQAALLARDGSARRLRGCAWVDASHAASMLALAAGSRRWRALALRSLLLALCFAGAASRAAAPAAGAR